MFQIVMGDSCDGNHRWARTGLFVDGTLRAPCLRDNCEAELQVLRNGRQIVNPHGFSQDINGVKLDIIDHPQGGVSKIVMREIQENYDLDSIPFKVGDVVIDVGAHVGIVSIYLAKRHPDIQIYAFEPVGENFKRLIRNLDANGVKNVVPIPKAVTCDGRKVRIGCSLNINSGGASIFATGGESVEVESVTLRDVFETFDIQRCRLLKIDCEGCEYEIFEHIPPGIVARIGYVRGELHANDAIGNVEQLGDRIAQLFDVNKVRLSVSGT